MRIQSISRPAAAAATLLFLAAACATAPAPGRQEGASQKPQAELAGMLSGRFEAGKWEVRVEPGSIAVRNESSGETLRFRRIGRA